jgi:hypothetical protein
VVSLRVTRDKRGYEHVYLVADPRRRGRADSRLLYWCRMPGSLRVGREPFDADTREALERANPDVEFDWPALTKSLAQSLAAARWAARQERPGGAAAPAKNARRAAGRGGDARPGRPGGGDRDRGDRGDRGRDRGRDANAGRQGSPRGPSAESDPPAEAEPAGE